jgi:serine/threonine protein kinase
MQAWVEDAHLHIQTEYLPAGTLRDAIAAADEPIAEERIWDWTAQLLEGLSFLHSHRLIHLDIKPDNVFLTRDGGLKIGDLGTSVREGSRAGTGGGAEGGGGGEEGREEVEEGDAVYIAPELLDPSLGAVSAKADVFSLGLTLFEISADVILPTRGSAWNELRHERIDWAGSSYFLSDSPVSSASPDLRWMQTGNRLHDARAAAAECMSPIVMEAAAVQEERLPEMAAGGANAQRRLSTPAGKPMPSPPQSAADRVPDAFKSPVMQPHAAQRQAAAAEAEDEQPVSTPLVRSHLRARSTPCSSFSSPTALPLTSYDSPAVTKSSLPPLHPSQSSASLFSSAEDGSHCCLPTLKRRRSSSVSVGAGAGRSAALQSLVMSLLRRDPARRPTVAEVLQHPAVIKAMDRRREAAQQQQQRSVRVTEPRKLFDERGRLL